MSINIFATYHILKPEKFLIHLYNLKLIFTIFFSNKLICAVLAHNISLNHSEGVLEYRKYLN